MRIIFFNIGWMKFYKGQVEGVDYVQSGGSYVAENRDGCEKYNFDPEKLHFDDDFMPDGEYCLGFVETKSYKGVRNQLRIEYIDGCSAAKSENTIEDVLVIYCAKHPEQNISTVVGWYNHATVCRTYREYEFESADAGIPYYQCYNAIAKAEDCVLLPVEERNEKWAVPRASHKGNTFGIGTANVWYAINKKDNEELKEFLERIVKQIEEYNGINWLYVYPED